MPRKAKTQTPKAPQEQGYGERGDQIASQNAIPLPENRAVGPGEVSGMSQTTPQATAPPGNPGAPTDMAGVLAMLGGMQPAPGGLAAPTATPDAPLLPETQQTPTRNVAADTLEQMAQATGDPRFTRMAQIARRS